jgi:signal transduction histidine kinase
MSNQLLTDLEQKKLTQKDLIQGISHIREVAKLLLLNSQKVTDLVGTFKHAAVDEWQEPATEFSLNKLLRDAKEQCDFRNETSTNISIDCAGDIIIFGYAAALRESLVLLMDNAIHFALLTQEDKATVSVKKKQDTVVITLIDTGKGMTKEQSEKLFEPFYTSRRSQNRIGLGAHIAHNLITQKCRGTIKLVSEPLQATHIDIEIPRLLKSL